MVEDITIYQPWGGLGDNMAHSVLPELCHNLGIKCYLSKQNVCRSKEIFDFVWGKNPFLKDTKNFTDLTWFDNCSKVEVPGINHIEVVQKAHGLPVTYHYPKIYYSPKLVKEAVNKTIIDLSAYSIGRDYNPQNLKKVIESFKLEKENTLSTIIPNVTYGTKYETDLNTININSLEHYSDIIFSCNRFITLHSGQACLASTIKFQTKSNTEIYVLTMNRYLPQNNCGYTFQNTKYISCE